jgi:hypothetical protein
MGCRRAGWYSYDGLDNGGVPGGRSTSGMQRRQLLNLKRLVEAAPRRIGKRTWMRLIS